MPIILAIEPDRRQAAHLVGVVRHLVGAELILAHTTEGALDAIGNRVPDLVLVPALLSPQDDAALAAALRVIAAAAHVRTLTIPVLASGTKRALPGGMLAKWRRSRAASPEPDGCDPAVFGEQISTYLKEAAAECAELEEESLEVAPPTAIEAVAASEPPAPPSPVEEPWTESIEPWAAEPVQPWAAPPTAIEAVAAVEPPASPSPVEEPWMESIEPWAAEPVQPWAAPPTAIESVAVIEPPAPPSPVEEPWTEWIEPWAAEPVQPWAADPIEQSLIDLSDKAGDELFEGERVGTDTISAEADEPELDGFDLLPAILESQTIARHAAAPVAEAGPKELFVEPPEPPRADIEPWVPMYLTPGRMWPALQGMPAETPAPRTEQPDWIELVASLRQDLERRRTDPPSAAADPVAARPSDGGEADAHRLVKTQKSHAKKAKPIQDEWGFFDPEQCGFSTLLAKLEEITEEGAGS